MPTRTKRSRKLARRLFLIPLSAIFLACSAAWILTHRSAAALEYRFGSYIEPGTPGGDPTWYGYRARTLALTSARGVVYLRSSVYLSLAEHRETLDSWKNAAGWQASTIKGARPTDWGWVNTQSSTTTRFTFLGLGYSIGSSRGETARVLCIPYWLPMALASTAALLLWLPGHRRRRRTRTGRCPACGYNRIGLLATEPCPECGKPPPA